MIRLPSGLVGNRKPTLAAHLTATTAHQGMAPRTTQAGATSGALDTHRSTLGDRRHVACNIHDSHRDPLNQRYIRIPPRDHPHAFPADLEAPVHTSEFAHTRGIPVGVQKTAYTLVGLFREVRNHNIYILGRYGPHPQ